MRLAILHPKPYAALRKNSPCARSNRIVYISFPRLRASRPRRFATALEIRRSSQWSAAFHLQARHMREKERERELCMRQESVKQDCDLYEAQSRCRRALCERRSRAPRLRLMPRVHRVALCARVCVYHPRAFVL